jgi:hypothetical protein
LGLNRATYCDRLKTAARRGMLGPVETLPGFAIKSIAKKEGGAWIKQQAEPGEVFKPLPGHRIVKETAYVDAETRLLGKWVTAREGAVGEGLIEAIKEQFEQYRGLAPIVPPPEAESDDTLTFYPLSDLHMGMMAWGKETGESYDISIACKLIKGQFDTLASMSPPGHGLIVFLGDTFHANDSTNRTPKSGHHLDVDGRRQKVLRAAVEVAQHVIGRALQVHQTVEVITIRGNHDPDASEAFNLALSVFYSGHIRVKIDPLARDIAYREFGTNLLGFSHGHTMPPERQAQAMAADMPEAWGRTTCRRAFHGHFHREASKMVGAVKVECVGIITPQDSYSFAGGWRGERLFRAYRFDRHKGERGSSVEIVRPDMAA